MNLNRILAACVRPECLRNVGSLRTSTLTEEVGRRECTQHKEGLAASILVVRLRKYSMCSCV